MPDHRHSTDFHARVLDPLRLLGRTLKRYVLIEGLCETAVVFALAAALHLGLDRLLVLGTVPRAILLLAFAALLGHQCWHRILRPATVRIDPNDMAALVERRHPDLKDLLVTAVAFATGAGQDDRDASTAMVGALTEQSARRFASLGPRDVLRHRRHRHILAIGLAVVATSFLTAVLAKDTLATYFARDFLLADVAWPSRTRITLEGFSNNALRWPRGDDLTLVATAHKEVPSALRAEFRLPTGDATIRNMDRRGDNQFVLDCGPLSHSMQVRLLIARIGADEPTDWYTVEAISRPAVKQVDIEVTPHAYTGLEPFHLAQGQTDADILRGSRVRIGATLNKPVARAELRLADQPVAAATREGDERISVAFVPVRSGAYFFDIVDGDGFEDTQPVTYTFRLLPDPAPKVRMALPGAGEIVVPNAILNLAVQCEDNLGLRSVELLRHVARRSADRAASPATPIAEPLPDVEPGRKRYETTHSRPLLPLSLHPGDQLTLQARAADFQPPGGTSEATGDAPRAQPGGTPPEASQGPLSDRVPGVGKSVAFSLRIVTPEDLLAELGRREHEWRRQFEQIIKAQELIQRRIMDLEEPRALALDGAQRGPGSARAAPRTPTVPETGEEPRASARAAPQAPTWPRKQGNAEGVSPRGPANTETAEPNDPAASQLAARYAREQRIQRQQIGRLETVRRQFDQILAELSVNQLAGPGVRRRLDVGVITPLARLVNIDVPAAADLMEQLRLQFEPDAADQLEQAEAALVESMYGVLANMLKWEGYSEAVSLLQDIIRLQQNLSEETRARLQKEVEALFGDEPPPRSEDRP